MIEMPVIRSLLLIVNVKSTARRDRNASKAQSFLIKQLMIDGTELLINFDNQCTIDGTEYRVIEMPVRHSLFLLNSL